MTSLRLYHIAVVVDYAVVRYSWWQTSIAACSISSFYMRCISQPPCHLAKFECSTYIFTAKWFSYKSYAIFGKYCCHSSVRRLQFYSMCSKYPPPACTCRSEWHCLIINVPYVWTAWPVGGWLALPIILGVVIIQRGPKKWHNVLYALTLPNINRFSKFFHCQNQEKICNNIITGDPTTPQLCRYTTLCPTKAPRCGVLPPRPRLLFKTFYLLVHLV